MTDTRIDEVGKRYSLFYLLGCVASAFAGILAYGVSKYLYAQQASTKGKFPS